MNYFVHQTGIYSHTFGPFSSRAEAEEFAHLGCVFIETGERIPYIIQTNPRA